MAYNSITETIATANNPQGVAINAAGTVAYVACSASPNSTVDVINLTTGTVTTTISVGTYGCWCVIDPSGTYLYVICYVAGGSNGTVYKIAISSNTVVATLSVGHGPTNAIINPAGTYMYVANAGTNTVSVINLSTFTVTATITVGTQPYGFAINSAGTLLYCVNQSSNTVSVINTSTNAVTATITVGTAPISVQLSPNGALAYVTNYSSGTISIINTSTNAVIATITGVSNAASVALNPAGTYLYIGGSTTSNAVTVVSTATNTVVDVITGFTGPCALTFFNSGSDLAICNNTTSGPLAIVSTSGAPSITGATISGTDTVGDTLTATSSGVVGTTPITESYQWNRGGTAISGATSQTYTLQAADFGETLTVTITETNSIGSASFTSSPTATINRLAPTASATTSTLFADPSSISADGISQSLITVTCLSSSSAAVGVGGDVVTLATTLGTLSAVTDNGDGTHTATLTSTTTPGTATITGVLNGVALTATATVTISADRATTLQITTQPSTTAYNGSPLAVQPVVEVVDANGNVVTGSTAPIVAWSTVAGVAVANAGATAVAGVATFSGLTLEDATVGDTYYLQFVADGVQPVVSTGITISAPGAVAASGSSLITSTTSLPDNGTSKATLTVRSADSSGNWQTTGGATVVLSTTLGTLSAVTDNGDGTYTATLTGTSPGTATVSGTLNGSALANTVTIALVTPGTGGPTISPTVMPTVNPGGECSLEISIPGYTTTEASVALSADGHTTSGTLMSITQGLLSLATTTETIDGVTNYIYTITFNANTNVDGPYYFYVYVPALGYVLFCGAINPMPLTVALVQLDPTTGDLTTISDLTTASALQTVDSLSGPGQITLTIQAAELVWIAKQISARNAKWGIGSAITPISLVDPYAYEIHVLDGSTIIAAGPITEAQYDVDKSTVDITASSLIQYFEQRMIEMPPSGHTDCIAVFPVAGFTYADTNLLYSLHPDPNYLSYVNATAGAPLTNVYYINGGVEVGIVSTGFNIYQDLINREQAKTGGHLGIGAVQFGTGASAAGSGRLTLEQFDQTDTLASAFSTIQQDGPGYEFWINPNTRQPWVATYQGTNNLDKVILSNRNSTNISYDITGDDLTTVAWAEGALPVTVDTGTTTISTSSLTTQTPYATYPAPSTLTAPIAKYGRHVAEIDASAFNTTADLKTVASSYEQTTNIPLLSLTLTYDAVPSRPYSFRDIQVGDFINIEMDSLLTPTNRGSAPLTLPFRVTTRTLVAMDGVSGSYQLQLEVEQVAIDPTTGNPVPRESRSTHTSKAMGMLWDTAFKNK